MAVREIKTSIALDGEQAFKQALADASRNLRVMDADLKAAATEFKVTGDAQQYYTEKSRSLKEQIAQQEQVVDALVNAVRQSAAIYGNNSAKTDEWRIKLSNATAKLMTMKKGLQDTGKEAEEFGRDSKRVGKQIEDGIGDGAEEANKSVKDLIENLQQDIGSIKGSVGFQVAATVTQTISSAVQGMTEFVESNRDYRRVMEQYEIAAEAGKHNKDAMKEMLFNMAAFSGDFDGSVEAMTNLMQTGLTADWMEKATDIFSYASIMFKDTLKLEQLSGDFQESVATGKPTGAFANFVEKMGGSVEELEKVMSDAGTTEAKAIAALTYASPKGYKANLDKYNEKTKNIQAAAKAQMELADAWAEVAETLEPLTTSITMLLTKVVEGLGSAVRLLMGDVKGYAEELGMTEEEFRLEMTKKTGNAGWQNDGKTFRFDEVGDALKNIANGIFGGGESTGAKDAGEAAGQEYATALADAASSALLDDESLQNAIDLLTSGWTLGGEDEAANRLEQLGLTAEQKQQVIDEMGKLGMDMSDSLDTSLTDGMGAAGANAAVAGQNVGISAQNGLSKGFAAAYITTVDWVNRINAAAASLGSGLGAVPTYGLSNGGYFGGTLGRNRLSVTVPLNINGREIARATFDESNSLQGRQTSRASRLP
nr:MAG TPA: minor tail protein [Caudoviricetes sp.]